MTLCNHCLHSHVRPFSSLDATIQQETWCAWILLSLHLPILHMVTLSLRASADGPAPSATHPPLRQQSIHQSMHQIRHPRTLLQLLRPGSCATTPLALTLHIRASKERKRECVRVNVVWIFMQCVVIGKFCPSLLCLCTCKGHRRKFKRTLVSCGLICEPEKQSDRRDSQLALNSRALEVNGPSPDLKCYGHDTSNCFRYFWWNRHFFPN